MKNFGKLTIGGLLLALPLSVLPSSKIQWGGYGAYAAKVLPSQVSKNDSKYDGLVVECAFNNSMRITVYDIYSNPGDKISWKTNSREGTFTNKSSMVARSYKKDKGEFNTIISAIKKDSWIKFENITTRSSARYSLKGSSVAINGIKGCKQKG